MEQISYNEIRSTYDTGTKASVTPAANTSYDWPADPNPSSFLGLLRSKTGIDFDLPSEAQWEFAARAGNGSGYWGDGSAILNVNADTNLAGQGRYKHNGGYIGANNGTNPAANCDVTNGTAIVGSYAPNAWGLYDMHGNIWEWCLDWFEMNITSYGGNLNINRANPQKTLADASSAQRVRVGGNWGNDAGACRPANRVGFVPNSRYGGIGFRVLCSAGLQ
jgi:formylglycine-generating enzyme required for sulfatase activity